MNLNLAFSNEQRHESTSVNSSLKRMNEKRKLKEQDNKGTTDGDNAIDEESLKGRFGWATVEGQHIPYIFRGTEKFCAVRIVVMKVFGNVFFSLHDDIYSCTCIKSYYITSAEEKLLNEINFIHCDSQFGIQHFTTKDIIVKLSDVEELQDFVKLCYRKLKDCTYNNEDRCGFIRVNKKSAVPYSVHNGQKYIPLFYFCDGQNKLAPKSIKLEGWDLSYLKFCCRVQCIRPEFFKEDFLSVISFNDIKKHFRSSNVYEEYWPLKMLKNPLLNNQLRMPKTSIWARRPDQPLSILPDKSSSEDNTTQSQLKPIEKQLPSPNVP